ncbi:hypothetical protein ACH4T9_12515 [Micromonospora sp. NPDC020750]|uniref:hypothetical protein n=1 Tax=unclassified Micromonospora TaxID=2617518 RepID=UPI0037B52EE9
MNPTSLTAADILARPWTAVPNDEIGGWAVSTDGRSPADGGVMAADMVWSQQVGEHIADLHNARLDQPNQNHTLGIESAGPSSRGGFEFRLRPGIDLARNLTQAARAVLDGHGANNYVEMRFADDSGEEYIATFQRRDGRTPDELRRQAETDRDTFREVARRNKRHVAVLTELVERVEQFATELPEDSANRLRGLLSAPTTAERGSPAPEGTPNPAEAS